MFNSIGGRSVVVTGGSKGIGRGISQVFASKGARVMVVGRDESRAESTAAGIRDGGGDASAFSANVADPTDVERMVAAALERHGGIDILCANAGIFPEKRLMEMTVDQWNEVLTVNLTSAYLCVKACMPALVQSGRGRVILTSSITGPITGYPGWRIMARAKQGSLGSCARPRWSLLRTGSRSTRCCLATFEPRVSTASARTI